MPGPVSFETMVKYVGDLFRETLSAVNRVGDQMDRHEVWHREHLEDQLRDRSRNGWSWTQTLINLVVAGVAVASLIIAVVHGH